MNRDEAKSKQILSGVALNKQAASSLGTKTLNEELKTAGDGLGTQLTEKMQADKDKFIQRHKIKKSH